MGDSEKLRQAKTDGLSVSMGARSKPENQTDGLTVMSVSSRRIVDWIFASVSRSTAAVAYTHASDQRKRRSATVSIEVDGKRRTATHLIENHDPRLRPNQRPRERDETPLTDGEVLAFFFDDHLEGELFVV
jgi:hypothetical protein